jgi:uncharacterized protein
MPMHQPVTEIPASSPTPEPGPLRRICAVLVRLLLAGLALWLVAMGYLWFKQESLLFHPESLAANTRFDLDYTSEVYIDVPGAKLHALYLRQPPEQTKGIVLFLHGNAGNLETWFTKAEFWLSTGYDVLMPDYRGFGKSTGYISSEKQLHDDVMRMWQWVAPNYRGKKKVFYGRSLGTGLAAKLATQVEPDLLVLVSPYTSMSQMARDYYPWVPSLLLRYPLPTEEWLPQIHSKILLLHGTADALISPVHSQQLQKLNPRTRLVEIPDATHGDIHHFPLYADTLKQALEEL